MITAASLTPDYLRSLAEAGDPAWLPVLASCGTVLADALEIADDCARSDIECNCPCWDGEGSDRHYDTTPREDVAPEENESIAQAVRYLTARGHIVCTGALVRFTKAAG